MHAMPDDTVCEIHDWDYERVRKELLPLMSERHGKGGVSVCVECIKRAREEALKRARAHHGGSP